MEVGVGKGKIAEAWCGVVEGCRRRMGWREAGFLRSICGCWRWDGGEMITSIRIR